MTQNSKTNFKQKWLTENTVTIAIFVSVVFSLALISLPLALNSKPHPMDIDLVMQHSFPPITKDPDTWKQFPTAFEKYYNDRFGNRDLLCGMHSLICLNLFHVTGSKSVLAGKDSWYFFTRDGDRETIFNAYLFSDKDLYQWKQTLSERKNWLAKQGIGYMLVFAPSKCKIYGEYLPNGFSPIRPQSRLNQLTAYLKAHSDIDVLDLSKSLLAAKADYKDELYKPTDTHWNRLGAMVATNQIISRLQPQYPKLTTYSDDSLFKAAIDGQPSGDLPKMLGLGPLVRVHEPYVAPKVQTAKLSSHPQPPKDDPADDQYPLAYETADGSLPRIALIGDSFSRGLVTFLEEKCRRLYENTRDEFPTDAISQEHPDLVIQEYTERKLYWDPPKNPKELLLEGSSLASSNALDHHQDASY